MGEDRRGSSSQDSRREERCLGDDGYGMTEAQRLMAQRHQEQWQVTTVQQLPHEARAVVEHIQVLITSAQSREQLETMRGIVWQYTGDHAAQVRCLLNRDIASRCRQFR